MKKVAFICVHNSCRSQIAEALGKKLASDTFESYSAGTETKPNINSDAVRLMKQVHGIDMESNQHSKLLSELPEIDIVITMGCNVQCPFLPCKHREDWGLDDPSGKEDEAFLYTMQRIEEKVLDLKRRIASGEIAMKILCFGDSNTWGYDPRGYFGGRYDHPWPELLAEKLGCTILNWGENGREIPASAMDFPADTDLLIVMLGTNDLLQGASLETISGRMERFVKPLNWEKLLLIAPPPMKLGAWVPSQKLINDSKALTKHYQDLSERLGIRFADAGKWNVPLAYDGVHMTGEGHRSFADGLIEYLHKGE